MRGEKLEYLAGKVVKHLQFFTWNFGYNCFFFQKFWKVLDYHGKYFTDIFFPFSWCVPHNLFAEVSVSCHFVNGVN
jgi:hypothetical protein